MKITKSQFRNLLKEYYKSLLENQDDDLNISMTHDIFLYSYVPKKDLESVMFYGLSGTRGIIENEDLLNSLFYDQEAKQAFVDRYDREDMTQQGPSIFFQMPDKNKILEIDPGHILSDDQYVLIEINYNDLNDEPGYQGIYGLELIPYDDKNYEKLKDDIEHHLSAKEIRRLSNMSFEEAWANYKPGYFATNVPHGVVLTKSGIIYPGLIKVID